MRGSAIVLGALALRLVACSAAPPCPVERAATVPVLPNAPPRASTGEAVASLVAANEAEACPIWYSELDEAPEVVPARFSAAIPHEPQHLIRALLAGSEDNGPPWGYLRDGICYGDADVQRRLRESLEQANQAGFTGEQLRVNYGGLLLMCPRAEHVCSFLLGELKQHPPPALADLFYDAIDTCVDDATAQFFTNEQVPAVRYVEWHDTARKGDSPRLRQMVGEVLRTGALDKVTMAARQLADLKTPDAHAFLLGLQRKLADAQRRTAVGIALKDVPGAKANYERSCHAARSIEMLSFEHQFNCISGASEPQSKAWAAVLEYGNGWYQKPRQFTEVELASMAQALAQCVDDDAQLRDSCLAALAAVAPAEGVARAKKYVAELDIELREVALAVINYPDNPALVRRLQELGMKGTAAAISPAWPRLRAINLLEVAAFELGLFEFSFFAPQSTALYEMRRRMPGLEHVVFDESRWRPAEQGTRRFWAYDGRTRFEGQGGGDSPMAVDFTSAVGFMNSLARRLRVNARVAIAAAPRFESPRPISFVVGPEQSLCELDRSKMLRLARVSPRR